MSSLYVQRVKVPSPDSINTGLTSAKQSTMMRTFGAPRNDKPRNSGWPTNKKLLSLIDSNRDVGPFRVSGLKLACDSLERIFERVKKEKPEFYVLLQSAGMLNVRLVRGSDENFSNHSWGSAIDIMISGILDSVGDGYCLRGLLELYRYFHEEGWYWGSEFKGKREDSMHFELADETIRKWYSK